MAASASNSVTINTPGWSKPHYTLKAEFSETGTSGNTSTISVKATLSSDVYGSFDGSNNGTLKIYWYDNNAYSSGTQIASITVNSLKKSSSTSASGTKTVTHNADGTLKGYAKAVWTKSGSNSATPYSKEVSTAETALTKTDVAPVFTTNPYTTSISETSITINRGVTDVNSNFSYSISPNAGTKSESGATVTYSGLSAGTTYTITVTAANSAATSMTTSQTVSGTTWTWPTISSISANTLAPGNSQTIYLNNPHGRSVTWYMRSNSTSTSSGAQVSTGTTTGTSVTFTPSVDTLFNATNGLGTTKTSINAFYYISYSGNISSTTGTVAISEANYKPTWGNVSAAAAIQYQDTNTTAVTVTGSNQKVVAGKSILQYQYVSSGHLPTANRSTISKYQMSINNGSYTDLAADTLASYTVPSTATGVTFSLIAVDARGFKSDPLTLTIASGNFYKYTNPTGTIEVKRLNNYGTQMQLKINPIWAVGSNNANRAKIEYKISSASTWTTLDTGYTTFGSLNTISGTYANESTYNFKVTLYDKFGGTSSDITATVGPGVPIMFIDSTMNSVGFRCFPNNGTAIHINGPIQKDWYAVVGQSNNTAGENTWYKFASITLNNNSNTDKNILFKVYAGYGDGAEAIGELIAHVRTNGNKVVDTGSTQLKWIYCGSNIETEKFVMAYYNDTSGTNPIVNIELWVSVTQGWRSYKFIPQVEGDREKEDAGKWTLYKTRAASGQAAPTEGYTLITSSIATLKNSINGNANTSSTFIQRNASRITTPNFAHEYVANKATKRLDTATGSITEADPGDGWIETYFWDNSSSWDAQLYIPNGSGRLKKRVRANAESWPSTWTEIAYYSDIPVDSGWQNISRASGYNAGSLGTPQYKKVGNQVFIRGSWSTSNNIGSSSVTLGTLPSGYRPAYESRWIVPENGTGYIGRISIDTNGAIKLDWFGNTFGSRDTTTFTNIVTNFNFWID